MKCKHCKTELKSDEVHVSIPKMGCDIYIKVKEFESLGDRTFEEHVDFCTGQFLKRFVRGENLKDMIWQICNWSATWNQLQGEKK
jgi:hypothetical protein